MENTNFDKEKNEYNIDNTKDINGAVADIVEASSTRETYISLILRGVDMKIKDAISKGIRSFSFAIDYDLLNHNTYGLVERIKMSNQSNIHEVSINYSNPNQLNITIFLRADFTVSKMEMCTNKALDMDSNASGYPVKMFIFTGESFIEHNVSKCILYTDINGDKALAFSNSTAIKEYMKACGVITDVVELN